jgi:hypothetical protein
MILAKSISSGAQYVILHTLLLDDRKVKNMPVWPHENEFRLSIIVSLWDGWWKKVKQLCAPAEKSVINAI